MCIFLLLITFSKVVLNSRCLRTFHYMTFCMHVRRLVSRSAHGNSTACPDRPLLKLFDRRKPLCLFLFFWKLLTLTMCCHDNLNIINMITHTDTYVSSSALPQTHNILYTESTHILVYLPNINYTQSHLSARHEHIHTDDGHLIIGNLFF